MRVPDRLNRDAVMALISQETNEASDGQLRSYLSGALRDGTYSSRHKTFRLAQSDLGWRDVVRTVLDRLGRRNWTYREGSRNTYVVEWCGHPAEAAEAADGTYFARGYFDAEGGIPSSPESRFYIQLTQKDLWDLDHLRAAVIRHGIVCGRLHNPSVRVDPDYWRFYVAKRSHADFAVRISSWHPRKRALLERHVARLTLQGNQDHRFSA